MNKRAVSKTIIMLLIVGLTMQVGFTAYSTLDTQPNNIVEEQSPQEVTNTTEIQEEDIVNTEISEEVQNLIKQSDPVNFEKNMTKYKNLLLSLNVHGKLKEDIEGFIRAGHKLPDILSGYEFLYHAYGTVQELENFILLKESGKAWNQVFSEYSQKNKQFIPRAFEPDYLEDLMKTPGLTSDDIMIADRISHESGLVFEDLINKKLEGKSWKTINVESNILNTASILPRVEVTSELLKKYLLSSGLTEQQVVEAFVLANKLGKGTDDIIGKIKVGQSEETIFEEYLVEKNY